LQNYWQASNKGTFGHPGGLVHAFLHGLGTLLILCGPGIVFEYFWLYAIVDAVTHYFIDWAKVNATRKLGLTFKDPGYWWLLGIDQYLHTLVYISITYNILKHL